MNRTFEEVMDHFNVPKHLHEVVKQQSIDGIEKLFLHGTEDKENIPVGLVASHLK